ncbi:hypothetical protein SLS62_008008 [Diatrype stigma]|uniref:Retinol dehydrogenase 12 n=1 Tax=Diatrype stigma TaxID=117547 RepID=A0AAN9UNA5_9PEZI
MSAQLEKQASFQATFAHNFWKQLFTRVPPIPASIGLLTGKTVLVTGSNTGLGLEGVRHFLALRPDLVIMAVRSVEKGEAAAAGLRGEFPGVRIEVWELDMESLRSVQAFAARCERELDRLHIALLNAGLGKLTFERVEEGGRHEVTIQVNYLATALLAILLLPKMKPSVSSREPGRLSIVNSEACLGVTLDDPDESSLLDSLDRPEDFDGFGQYAKSKLLVMMFASKLAQVVSPNDVTINCSDPGATKGTAFFRMIDSWIISKIVGAMLGVMGRQPTDAARIYLHSTLVLGEESHGSWTDWKIRAWPKTMYTDTGRRIGDKLWDETLKELEFAGVRERLNETKH